MPRKVSPAKPLSPQAPHYTSGAQLQYMLQHYTYTLSQHGPVTHPTLTQAELDRLSQLKDNLSY